MNTHQLLRLVLSAVGLSACGVPVDGEACIDVAEDATTCPAAEDVDLNEAFVYFSCDDEKILGVSGDGELKETSQVGGDVGCCYDAELVDTSPNSKCVVGRPLREAEIAVLAAIVARADWGGVEGAGGDPARAAAWAEAGAAEHASIAAFSKLALELLAHGAPASLVRAVHQAGIDEIDHAERCFALAGRFGGAPVGPGPFPFTLPIDASRPLADIAADAVREGCIGETTGAVLARAAAEAAPEADVREALRSIAADEERHAALSWQIVAWASRVGGEEVRAAVRAAFSGAVPGTDVTELAVRARVDPDLLRDAVRAGLTEVIRPAARALLAA